jgi:hypothetical protein
MLTLVTQLKTEAMLEYAKVILPKVSFSRELFRKELIKCINWVEPKQVPELRTWCYKNFTQLYPNVLAEAFENIAA